MAVECVGLLVLLSFDLTVGPAAPPVPEEERIGTAGGGSQRPATPLTPAVARPVARGYHGLAYDSESDRTILFGGQTAPPRPNLADTWAYSVGENVWTELTPTPSPPAEGQDMVYLASSDRVVLFQGNPPRSGPLEHVWEYDFNANAWTLRQAANALPWRNGFRVAYDEQSDRIVLFGGARSFLYNDTWVYDPANATWTQMSPSVSPPGRNWHRLVYDAKRDRTVLFGGDTPDQGVWAYDYETDTWESMGAIGAPGPRIYHDMVYDRRTERIVLFGGVDVPSENPNNDTWEYDLGANSWTKLTLRASPSRRGWHAMAYNSQPDRIVLFGGGPDRDHNTRETWVLDLGNNTWTLADAPVPPLVSFTVFPAMPTAGASVAFDATASSDPDGDILAYDWAFGDGGTATGVQVQHTYTSPGTFSAALTATDSDGLFAVAAQDLVIVDATNPSVAITSPADGAVLSAPVATVTGTASDDVALGRVELSLDGTTWTLASGATAWSSTVTLAEGPNTIRARATDTSGNEATASRGLTVDTISPSVAITSPADGSTLASPTVNVAGTASDNLAVARVELSVDDVNWVLADGTTGWSGTLTLGEGPNTIRVRATDTAGNRATSGISVIVQAGLSPLLIGGAAAGVAAVAAAVGVGVIVARRRRRRR